MTEMGLSSLLQMVFEKLASSAIEKTSDAFDIREAVENVQRTLPMLQAVLEDAEQCQVTEKEPRIWLAQLKTAAYEADDLLDKFMADARRIDTQGSKSQVHNSLSLLESAVHLSKTGLKLKEKLVSLDAIAGYRSKFHLREVVVDRGSEGGGRRQTGSFVIESQVYGRDDDKNKIIELLLSANTSKCRADVSVIPIVGIGGIGKTTLAQLAYNDERVTNHFDVKMWVFVSDDFNVTKLIKAIIESATKNRCDVFAMDLLQSQLHDSLLRKRYLLVLDDLWNEDHNEWDKLRILLTSGAEGSKIIVTTRSKKVASIMGTTSPHHLGSLSEDDCWDLFKQRTFGEGEEEEHQNLWPIGKQIVKKCGGVPLAAQTLGSIMRFKREESEWRSVQESGLWNLCEGENGILPALRLSYSHLPSHLKRCFVYCLIFPKNYEIKKDKLIHMWMAEGLVLSSGGNRTLEDIGNEYFNDLLWMGFFQDVYKCEESSVTRYKMHDIIRALAQSIVGDEFMILEHGRAPPRDITGTRHSAVVCDFRSSAIPEALYEANHLRTLFLLFSRGDFVEAPPKMFSSFRYLRVLDMSGCGIKRLHRSIGSLTCLRYLDLSNTHVETLPETICDLCNLQTLNLLGCENLKALPSAMGIMNSLRHLNIEGCRALTRMPTGIGRLVHLQTLPIYIVTQTSGERIVEISKLNLQGELLIKHLENVRDAEEAGMANLSEKQYLHSLGLSWGYDKDAVTSTPKTLTARRRERQKLHSAGRSEILKGLQPHQNLRKLSVEGYLGITFPIWILPNLAIVKLIHCRICEHLPTLGHLPFLKILDLQRMDGVKNIGHEFYGGDTQRPFPSLKELTLGDFPNLEEWSSLDGREVFPCLGKLIVNKCPCLKTMPFFPSLQHLELCECNTMILRSTESLTSLSILIIDEFPELISLSRGLLLNNSLLVSLTICSCPNLCSLPSELGNLVALKSLTICSCEKLSSLPQGLQNLKCLESLEISRCHRIPYMPEEGIRGLSSLRIFSIENCYNLSSLSKGLQHLTSLEHLRIMYSPSLASLPEGLQHVTTLQTLEIRGCPRLMALPEWIEKLVLLRSFAISDCPKILSLPNGLQCLNALQHLSIQDCGMLDVRCKQEGGEDWQKIAHIPHKYIGSTRLREHNSTGNSSR